MKGGNKEKGKKKDKRDENRGMVGKKKWNGKQNMSFCRKEFGKLYKLGLGRLSRTMKQYTHTPALWIYTPVFLIKI